MQAGIRFLDMHNQRSRSLMATCRQSTTVTWRRALHVPGGFLWFYPNCTVRHGWSTRVDHFGWAHMPVRCLERRYYIYSYDETDEWSRCPYCSATRECHVTGPTWAPAVHVCGCRFLIYVTGRPTMTLHALRGRHVAKDGEWGIGILVKVTRPLKFGFWLLTVEIF